MKIHLSKHVYALSLALMILPFCANAAMPTPPDTLWAMTYDAGAFEKAFDARATEEGGYILCGSTTSAGLGNLDAYLVKTDPRGNVTWTKTYGGEKSEELYEIRQTADGGYIAIGYTSTNTAGYYDFYFIRTDPDGDTLWTRKYGGIDYDYGYSAVEAPGGGFIIAGRTSSYGRGWRSAYFIRTDANGDTLWTRAHGGSGQDEVYSVAALPDGGFVATGYTESYGAGGSDLWVLRLNEHGDTLWTRTYGGAIDERGEDIRRTDDRGFIIAGRSNSFNPPFHDVYIVRMTTEGDSLWTKTYGGASRDHAYSVSQTLDGGFIVSGYTDSYGAGGRDAYLLRCDAAGDTLWSKTLGAAGTDYGYSAEQTSDGGYMLSGWTTLMGAGDGDAYLATLAPSGGCPLIQEVSDVPSDDGGYVEISWLSSFYDRPPPDDAIVRYKVWRETGEPVISLGALGAGGHHAVNRPADRYQTREGEPLWELVAQVPAEAGSAYSHIVETACGPLHEGQCRGCFFVSAHTGVLGERYNSPVMCGYSENNLDAPERSRAEDRPQPAEETYIRTAGPLSGGEGCRIEFAVSRTERARVDLYSITGRNVATLLDTSLDAGEYRIEAGRLAAAVRNLAPGTYFARLSTPSASRSTKLVIIR